MAAGFGAAFAIEFAVLSPGLRWVGKASAFSIAARDSGEGSRNNRRLAIPVTSASYADASTLTPGTRFCARSRPKFMRANSAAEFIHSELRFEYPVGSSLRYNGSP